jgi:hypothetical protein
MRMIAPLAVWLVYGSLAAAQDVPKPHIRFFNDSAKAVGFYVDGQFGCSVPANPEGNNAYCDAETDIGKHKVSVKGAKLQIQSCDLYLSRELAEAHLSKAEHFNCFSFVYE